MKSLLLVTLTFFAINAFSSEEGESVKSPCPFANQSADRGAKIIEQPFSEQTAPVATGLAQ